MKTRLSELRANAVAELEPHRTLLRWMRCVSSIWARRAN